MIKIKEKGIALFCLNEFETELPNRYDVPNIFLDIFIEYYKNGDGHFVFDFGNHKYTFLLSEKSFTVIEKNTDGEIDVKLDVNVENKQDAMAMELINDINSNSSQWASFYKKENETNEYWEYEREMAISHKCLKIEGLMCHKDMNETTKRKYTSPIGLR